MRRLHRFPLGFSFSGVAALVFAAPTLFLPADAHVSVKLVFIVAGCLFFSAGLVSIRREGRTRGKSEPDGGAITPR